MASLLSRDSENLLEMIMKTEAAAIQLSTAWGEYVFWCDLIRI
jgi:hypothetical protein